MIGEAKVEWIRSPLKHSVRRAYGSMMKIVLLPLLFLLLSGQANGQSAQPTKIRVHGVELHYIEQGQEEPVILLHGGQGDYRSWESQIKAFSQHYRVISYSRRYNYPQRQPAHGEESFGLCRSG